MLNHVAIVHFALFMPTNQLQKLPVDIMAGLISQHRVELSHFISKKLGNPHLTDDLLQDAYIRLLPYQSLAAIDNPRAFVFRIVANLIIDYQRNCANRLPHDHDETLINGLADPYPAPDQHYQAQQRFALLKAALDELPATCRQVFYLNRIEGYSHKDCALTLQISESMVTKHLLHAMNHCRDHLKNS